jgi:hypothetical protein
MEPSAIQLCGSCGAFDFEEWLYPPSSPEYLKLDSLDERTPYVELNWLTVKRNQEICAFCSLIVRTLRLYPQFLKSWDADVVQTIVVGFYYKSYQCCLFVMDARLRI